MKITELRYRIFKSDSKSLLVRYRLSVILPCKKRMSTNKVGVSVAVKSMSGTWYSNEMKVLMKRADVHVKNCERCAKSTRIMNNVTCKLGKAHVK